MKNKTIATKVELLMVRLVSERGSMTAGQLIKMVNEEFLVTPEKPMELLGLLLRLQKNGVIPSDKIIPTTLPTVFTHEEIIALETILKEAKACREKLTFLQMAERTIERSGSSRPLGSMEQKIRFLLIPLSSGEPSDEEDDN